MTEAPLPPPRPRGIADRMVDLAAAAVITPLLALPYARRVPLMGAIGRRIIGPLGGAGRRIRANLDYVLPGLSPEERRRIEAGVLDNFGRSLIELFSGAEFAAHAARQPVSGAGLEVIEAARAEKRPVVLVTAHLGNYDAARAALIARGFPVGGFYRPMANPLYNRRYVEAIRSVGEPLFPAGREGMSGMLRFLRAGGMLGMVVDHHIGSGEVLDFMGRPARTALSAAELALRYEAPLVPLYGIRAPDGLGFEVIVEAPIAHSDARSMTEALNASTAAQVMAHKEQWFWLHRRWKDAG